MPPRRAKKSPHHGTRHDPQPAVLKGWKQIADFLGQPLTVVQRWGRTGMPVNRQGRHILAVPEQLHRWLGRESGMTEPAHIVAAEEDLLADLKRGLMTLRGRTTKRHATRR